MKDAINRIKREFEANPMLVIAAAAALVTATAKLMDANTRRVQAKTWALEVERRRMNDLT